MLWVRMPELFRARGKSGWRATAYLRTVLCIYLYVIQMNYNAGIMHTIPARREIFEHKEKDCIKWQTDSAFFAPVIHENS